MADYRVEDIKIGLKELRDDLKEFISTRVQILVREMNDKLAAIKIALPFALVAIACAVMALFVLTGALVYVIALGIGTGYALLAVGLFYLLVTVIFGGLAYREITAQSMAPKKTIHVLKEDQTWLQKEARSA